MVLSIVSICLSSFTALIVTIMPIIQTLIKNRNDRKMEKYKHVQQEQRKTYNDLLEKYIDYSLSINETTKRNLCIAISKAELFAKSDVEKRRYFILRSMLIKNAHCFPKTLIRYVVVALFRFVRSHTLFELAHVHITATR